MATRVVIRQVLSVGELFELTRNTTYQEYVHAVRSNLVTNRWRLQPPDFPRVEVSFRLYQLPHLFHEHCPVEGAGSGAVSYYFDSLDEAIDTLVRRKATFWCAFCEKPLFFPSSCIQH
jgi:hypothetical protein